MPHLTHRQLDLFNRSVLRLHEPCDLDAMPDRYFEVMTLLLPGNLIHISLTKPGVGAVDAYLDQPAHEHLLKIAAHQEHLVGMPGVGDGSFYLAADRGPVSFHDLMPTDVLKNTVLWEFFCQPLDLEQDLSVNFHRTADLFCTLSTSRSGRPYTTEERLLLALLQPHLRQRFQHLLVAQPEHPMARGAIEGTLLDSHWLLCSDSGKVIDFGPGAQDVFLQTGLRPNGEIPAPWKDWLTGQLDPAQLTQPPAPLLHSSPAGVLTVHCQRNPAAGQHRLVFQLRPPLHGRLTPRETEVAHWLAEGKTNPEISTILGISRATVKVHVERILAKLSVENRTAAARLLRAG